MKLSKTLYLFFILTVLFACMQNKNECSYAIIPLPEEMIPGNKLSQLDTLRIKFKAQDDIASFFPWVESWSSKVKKVEGDSEPNMIFAQSDVLPIGGYDLIVGAQLVNILYNDVEGLKNALSTVQQFLFLNNDRLPEVEIHDQRKFAYRGMHLDVSRHMFAVEDIKKYIDYLAFYKYNNFHWHLTDDQGWRIEIKSFPRLQEVAAYRDETLIGHYNDSPQKFDNKRYGGYYTQKEIKEIVRYAGHRGINVIPEVDLPGHSSAILAAYPEFGCEEKEYYTATKWGIFHDVLCPKEETFEFLFQVFDEMIDMFPSRYYHIGGDECPKDAWEKSAFCQQLMRENGLADEMELQSYFIKRLEQHLNSKGKKIIGWDEILEGGLAPDATVMSWRGTEGGIAAANLNHDVIMTPTSHCYFDYYQSENPDEPLAIGGYLPISKVYELDPIPEELPQDKHKYILGAQGNVWTEYMHDFSHVEYMALARSATLSEVLWGKNHESMEGFYKHLYQHFKQWHARGVNMANHLSDVNVAISQNRNKRPKAELTSGIDGSEYYIKHPLDSAFSKLKNPEAVFNVTGNYAFYSTLDGIKGTVKHIDFKRHLGNSASITITEPPAEKYSGQGPYSLINGVIGSEEKYGGSEWLGFDGKDFEAEITWQTVQAVSSISMRFFNGQGQWIYLPSQVEMFAKDAGGNFKLISSMKHMPSNTKVAKLIAVTPELQTETIRIKASNFGIIPEGNQGAGHKSWLFVGEIEIK